MVLTDPDRSINFLGRIRVVGGQVREEDFCKLIDIGIKPVRVGRPRRWATPPVFLILPNLSDTSCLIEQLFEIRVDQDLFDTREKTLDVILATADCTIYVLTCKSARPASLVKLTVIA